MTRKFCYEANKILKFGPQNTVLYAYEAFGVEACRRIAQETRLPVVTRFQGTVVSFMRNTFADRLRVYPQFSALETQADCVIMTNDGSFGESTLRALGNTSPVLFLRNGLDLMGKALQEQIAAINPTSVRSQLGIKQKEMMFLTVSRLENWKKVDRAITGFAEYCKMNLDGKLVVVGEGTARNELEQMVNALHISDRVIFTGAVPHDDVYQYMKACDIFLSLYDLSNVGNPLLEAMTLGCCIVTLNVGDTNTLIKDRENAILLNKEELSALGAVMEELSRNADFRKQLGAAASAYAQEHFLSWEQRMDVEFREVSALLNKG